MRRKGFHLSTFILALCFGGVLAVSAIFAGVSYYSARELIDREVIQSFDYRHRIIKISMEERLGRTATRLSALSSSPLILDALLSNDRRQVEETLFEALQHNDTQALDVLMITGENGVIFGDVSSPLSLLSKLRQGIIQEASQAFESWFLSELKSGDKEVYALIYAVPIIEPELGRVVGAIHAAISLNNNLTFARSLKDAGGVDELLIMHGDKIISNATGKPLSAQAEKVVKSDSFIVDLGDDVASRMDVDLRKPDGLDVSLVTMIARNDSPRLSSLYKVWAMFLVIGALVTALIIAYMVRRLVGQSSRKLLSYVDEVRRGGRDVRFSYGPVQEFNRLGDVVGEMVATIHENERYLTNLIELANSPIIVWDGNGNITKFNRSAERIFGRKDEDVFGHPIKKVMNSIDVSEENKRSILERSLGGSVIDHWEMVQQNPKTHQDYYMSWSISPVAFHDDGTVATILAQGQDMTRRKHVENQLQRMNEELELRVMHRTRALEEEIQERRQIEESLKESEERFRDIAEASSDWFWEMDADFRFTYMSDRALNVTGYIPEEVIGKTRVELVGEELTKLEEDKWRAHEELLRRHEPFRRFEYTLRNSRGEEHVFRISGKPMFDPKSGIFLGYRGAGRDVTNDYLRQKELLKAKEEAESASQAKSEFLSSMSHELRTPLNGILGFAQLLLMGKANSFNDREKEFLEQIVKAGQHLLDLINEILDLAKIEARKVEMSLEGVQASFVMNDVMTMLENMANDRQVKLDNALIDKKLPYVRADYTRLKQVLANLGSNAIKYNKPDGEVHFNCHVCTDENMLEFEVIDNGPGISKSDLESLFQPFNRLGAEFSEIEGTGIGLTITQQLIELMDGRIGAESEVGKGSRFWFRLPIFDEESHLKDKQDLISFDDVDIADLAPDDHTRVLYVEDNPNNRILMEEVLSQVDKVDLKVTRTAEEGLENILLKAPHLIFLDINLPGMSGWEMIEKLKKNNDTKDIPVVAVTAQAMLSDVERGKKAGFADYLSKPLNVRQVLEVIQQYARKSEG